MTSARLAGTASIRVVTVDDTELVAWLVLAMLTDSPLAFGENRVEAQKRTQLQWQQLVEQLISPPVRTAYIAYDEEGGCGFVCADSSFPEAPINTVVISRLWVAPRQRGSGLGRRLMERATEWAREQHAGLVALGVTEMNTSALEFYQHLGYADSGIRMPWPPDPSKQIIVLGRELKE